METVTRLESKNLNDGVPSFWNDELQMTVIETASIRQLDDLYVIEKECFETEAFSKPQIASLLTEYNAVSLVAREEGKIAGFIIGTVFFQKDGLTGHILTIDVKPVFRRKGIGAQLLMAMEKLFKEKGVQTCCLEAREDNTTAIELYLKLGYSKVGRLRNYYGNAHGIHLKKPLA